jgi:type III restriction enzyme
MLALKDYQQRALDALSGYFKTCLSLGNADTAFYETTRATLGVGMPYRSVAELPGLPYICLRIPTGGGKTFVACHAVNIATKELLKSDRCVVLWLVPSNTIREQTLKALTDRAHPYRQALDAAMGAVTVLDVTEALYLKRATLDATTTIIVSTMQAFRVEDTEGRKVYEASGALMEHFAELRESRGRSLEQREDGSIEYSLANVLRVRRPVVIVDEAHNARTPLSFGTLARFQPSCIIEFTATPDAEANPSNVLHSVSAAELKAEAMIKLPIRLETRPSWKELLADAVAVRSQLEAVAKAEQQETREYIRPIMLIQAQPKRQQHDTLTVEVVKQCLQQDHHIHDEEIAVATAEDKELEGVDLLRSDCAIRFVITIQALREGWDCPFAYVLCSVAELRSSTAVEQILGRLMRLPKAAWKRRAPLNMAYAFSASQSFADAANALTDALVQNGFNKLEAKELITPMPAIQHELPLSGAGVFMDMVTARVSEAPRMDELLRDLSGKVKYDAGTSTLIFQGVMDDRERDRLKECFATTEGKSAVERIYQQSRGLASGGSEAPSQRGERLAIPLLAIGCDNLFEPADETHVLETVWRLSECDSLLSEQEFPAIRSEGQQGEITVNEQGRVEARFLNDLHQQITFLNLDERWTVPTLIHWLDRTIPHRDITPEESGLFLTRLVRQVVEQRGIGLEQLVHDKYRLREAATAKIDGHRRKARVSAYQALFFAGGGGAITVSPEVCLFFDPLLYPYGTLYQGAYRFKKHYYPQVGDLRAEGEEFECAQFLDALPEVKYWARNIERRPSHSFWLPTSSDKFYPDFVCLLHDGCFLVVEYKGEERWSNDDSKEKRDIGGLWEARSKGSCMFVMPKGKRFEEVTAKVKSGHAMSKQVKTAA